VNSLSVVTNNLSRKIYFLQFIAPQIIIIDGKEPQSYCGNKKSIEKYYFLMVPWQFTANISPPDHQQLINRHSISELW
jgi:hypothetical protein